MKITPIVGFHQCTTSWSPLNPSYTPSYFYPDQMYRYWHYYQPGRIIYPWGWLIFFISLILCRFLPQTEISLQYHIVTIDTKLHGWQWICFYCKNNIIDIIHAPIHIHIFLLTIDVLWSVQVLYKQVFPNSGLLYKQNKHGHRPSHSGRAHSTY